MCGFKFLLTRASADCGIDFQSGLGKLGLNRRHNLYAVVFGWFLFATFPPTPILTAELRTVKQVIDGDTILLESSEVVSLIGVDAPEIKHATKAGAEMGKESARL